MKVDMSAQAITLRLKRVSQCSYSLEVGKYDVQVDWIVRNDGYQKYYRAALQDAVGERHQCSPC